jgi:glutamyl-tRNA synthetase
MVDDHLMKITHVIRGSEWQSTLPLHALVLRAFGWEEPVWVHLSVFLKPSGKGKMSKRDQTQAIQDGHSIFVGDLKRLGYIPEGVLNWIVLMGWGVAENDVMTLDKMVQRFDIAGLNPAPAAVDFAKLDHFNATHIRALDAEDLAGRLKPYYEKAGCQVNDARLLQIIPLLRERLVILDDCIPFGAFFFRDQVDPKPGDLIGKDLTAKGSAEALRRSLQVLGGLSEITPETAETPMRSLVKELGLATGQVFGVLRVAVTGQTVSPPLFESMAVIGKKKVLERIRNAITFLEKMG